jgi:hypothetical protein
MTKYATTALAEHEIKLNFNWHILPDPYRLGLTTKTRTPERVTAEIVKRQYAALHARKARAPHNGPEEISGPVSGSYSSDPKTILAAINRKNRRDYLAADHNAAYRTDALICAAYDAHMRGEDVPLLCNYEPRI